MKCVRKVRINNIPSLVQIMAWRRPGNKPLSEPMMVSLLTHICVIRPQWVNYNTSPVKPSWSSPYFQTPPWGSPGLLWVHICPGFIYAYMVAAICTRYGYHTCRIEYIHRDVFILTLEMPSKLLMISLAMSNNVIHLTKLKPHHWQTDYLVISVPADGLAPLSIDPAYIQAWYLNS